MDTGVWVGAIAGLVGALVGAGGSIATTLVNQRYQRAEARRTQRDRLTRETVDAISRELVALEELARKYPEEGASESVMRPYRLAANEHNNRIDMELVRLPDRALADRLGDILWASRLAFQSGEGTYLDRRTGAFKIPYEGLSCLGAHLREDPLPPPSRYTQAAIENRLAREAIYERLSESTSETRALGGQ
ncbi:hypothetical protein [Kitasatospora sp. NPDC087314]|uniref:hypothetical protein n=1 Tax=Kitasatospora sp. NPDC087314 TaxID=3364068 RepID=UPI00380041B9